MPGHADILSRPERLTVPFWTSLSLHLAVLAAFGIGAVVKGSHINMGSPNGGGMGVLVTPVASIPIPNRGGPQNPVANDTESQVPTPPTPKEKAKPAPKPKPLTADEKLLMQMEKAPQKRPSEPQPNKFRDQQKYSPSQLYSDAGQRMSTSQFGMQGGGGVRLGDSSPFGDQFGAYANIIRNNIAQNWRPTSQRASPAVVTFTIHRDGSVTNVKVEKSSGISTMDNSAIRAVQDAQLPPLPPNFPRNQADVEMTFELGN